MCVCCSRDIQNMKEKRGTYWRLFKDQWSSFSLVRAMRNWAEWQNCLSKSSHQSMSRDNYRLWQFSASPSKNTLFCYTSLIFYLLGLEITILIEVYPAMSSSASTGQDTWELWRVNIQQELEEWLQKDLDMICWEAKLLWKNRPERYLASSSGPRLELGSLSLPTWSSLSLLHWFATLLFSWFKIKSFAVP